MLDEKKAKKILEGGKVDLFDIDRDADLMWALADLYCSEKHLNMILNRLSAKLAANPDDKKSRILFDAAAELFDKVRKERARHLKYLEKLREYGFWCQPKGSIVISNFGVKNIEEIRPGDKIFGMFGTTEVVGIHQRKYSGELYIIHPEYTNIPLVLSPEHPVLVASLKREKQKECWKKNIDESKIKFLWKPAEELTEEEFLVFPRVLTTKDKKEYTKELMELIGIYLAEGCISEYERQRKEKAKNGKSYEYKYKARYVGFFFGKHEKTFAERTQELIEKCFGYRYSISKGRTTLDIYIHKKDIVDFFEKFGRTSTTKKLPDEILYLPESKLYSLLKGFILGDGHIGNCAIKLATSSDILAFQLRMILFRLGIIHSIYRKEQRDTKIEGRTVKSRKGYFYEIMISGDSARILAKKCGFEYNGGKRTNGSHGYVFKTIPYILIPIRKIETETKETILYNITTEDATYLTHTGIVHNCLYKHLLGAMMQFGEVAAKEISIGNLERARECFETSEFCYNAIMFLNKLTEKIYNGGGVLAAQNTNEIKQSIQMQERRKGRSNIHSVQPCREEG